MFKNSLLTLALGTVLSVSGYIAADPTPAASDLKAEKPADQDIDIKKLSEAFGHFIGKNIKSSGLNFDIQSLIQGIQNGAEGKPAPMNEKDYEKGMMQLQERVMKKLAEDNLKAATTYLQENASKPNVVTVEPGKLQYIVKEKGTGEEVKEHGTPVIKYKGRYLDGTVFGNSEDAGGSITLPLDQTIPGFSKAIVGMKEGEKREIFVHPDLGYGTTGHLPPNSLLIFDVEVIKAQAPQSTDHASSQNEPSDEDDEDTPIAELDVNINKLSPGAQSAKMSSTSKSANTHDDEDHDDDDDEDDEDYDDDEDEDEDDEPNTPAHPLKK